MEYKMKPDIGLVVEFTTDRISLDIPIEGTGVLSGWKIIPLVRPVVSSELSVVRVCACVCVCVRVCVCICEYMCVHAFVCVLNFHCRS